MSGCVLPEVKMHGRLLPQTFCSWTLSSDLVFDGRSVLRRQLPSSLGRFHCAQKEHELHGWSEKEEAPGCCSPHRQSQSPRETTGVADSCQRTGLWVGGVRWRRNWKQLGRSLVEQSNGFCSGVWMFLHRHGQFWPWSGYGSQQND